MMVSDDKRMAGADAHEILHRSLYLMRQQEQPLFIAIITTFRQVVSIADSFLPVHCSSLKLHSPLKKPTRAGREDDGC